MGICKTKAIQADLGRHIQAYVRIIQTNLNLV